MSDDIINAIRLLVEDGAEVTYTKSKNYESTDYYQGVLAGRLTERERIIQIIEKRKGYDCRCSCDCHAEEAPCTTCQADNELIQIIKEGNK